jgi:hypothetical protein
MTSLVGIDPVNFVSISSRIKGLPSPEKIASMGHNDLMELSARVERLIFDIGNAKNSRTVGFAIRHRIDKGLPPRMRPLLANKDNWLAKAMEENECQADSQSQD